MKRKKERERGGNGTENWTQKKSGRKKNRLKKLALKKKNKE